MAHTPGEWYVVFADDGRGNQRADTVRSRAFGKSDQMADYQGCIVCDISEGHGNREHAFQEANDNARLIAAAPELLKMCKNFHAILRHKNISPPMNPGIQEDLEKKLGELIAKAKGVM